MIRMRNRESSTTGSFHSQLSHSYAISPAGPNDPFEGRGQRYTCVRCKHAFVVQGRKIVVLNDRDVPMTGNAALERLATFAAGPCIARKTPAPHRRLEVVSNRRVAHA